MPQFDLASLKRSGSKSSSKDYGFLVDQLGIKENQLKSDGKLSAGDYDVLIQNAQKLYSYPGLSDAQRSNVELKISGYQSSKKQGSISDASDIDRLNRDLQNETKNIVAAVGNDPLSVLKGKQALLESKMFQLKNIVADQDKAGEDSSKATLELNKTQNEWLDSKDALDFTQNYKPGGQPSPNFVLDIETSPKGEIRDVQVSRSGIPQSGYLPTSGVLGGFSIRGKVDTKIGSQSGKNVFRLGNTTFSASSTLRPGPDGSFQPDTLTTQDQQTAVGSRGRTKAVSEYVDLNPQSIGVQRSSNPGEWIQSNDSFYKDLGNGTYERHVGTTKDQLGINDSDLLTNLPSSILDTVKSSTVKTYDNTPQLDVPAATMNVPTGGPSVAPYSPAPQNTPQSAAAPGGSPRTPSPTVRSPQGSSAVAGSLLDKAKGFLGSLFNNTE